MAFSSEKPQNWGKLGEYSRPIQTATYPRAVDVWRGQDHMQASLEQTLDHHGRLSDSRAEQPDHGTCCWF